MFMSTMGKKGLMDIAKTNHLNTAYFVKEISKLDNVDIKYKKNFFNEVVLDVKNMPVDDFLSKLKEKNILAGVPLKWFHKSYESCVLVNFTELHRKADIDAFVAAIGGLK